MRTSYYLSKYKSSIATTGAESSSDFDEDLFSGQENSTNEIQSAKEKSQILKWLKEISASNPDLSDGLDDSIVSWFIQSGYLLPRAIGIRTDEKIRDLTTAISVLTKNGCLTETTLRYMKDFVETAPPVELVWRILNDIYHFALEKQNTVVPLTRVTEGQEKCVLQRDQISRFLKALDLPKLPNVFNEPKAIVDDNFRNGTFLFALYEKLTGEKIEPVSTAVSMQRAVKNTQLAIALFVRKNYIDQSFLQSATAIVNGNHFALQHLLSMILVNVSRIHGPLDTKTLDQSSSDDEHAADFNKITFRLRRKNRDGSSDYSSDDVFQKASSSDDQNDYPDEAASQRYMNRQNQEKRYIDNSTINDGISLPKLITAIDPKFSKVPYILVTPRYEVEKKWNIRKTVEYLRKKEQWPPEIVINVNDLIQGEEQSLISLYRGLMATYPSKFESERSVNHLKNIIGIN